VTNRHFVKSGFECTETEPVSCGKTRKKTAGTLAGRCRPLGRSSLALAATREPLLELGNVAVVDEEIALRVETADLVGLCHPPNPTGRAASILRGLRRSGVSFEELVELLLLRECHRGSRWNGVAPLRMVHWRQRTLKVPWDSEHTYTVVRLGLASRMEQRRLG